MTSIQVWEAAKGLLFPVPPPASLPPEGSPHFPSACLDGFFIFCFLGSLQSYVSNVLKVRGLPQGSL